MLKIAFPLLSTLHCAPAVARFDRLLKQIKPSHFEAHEWAHYSESLTFDFGTGSRTAWESPPLAPSGSSSPAETNHAVVCIS